MSTGREAAKEQEEIQPTPHMEKGLGGRRDAQGDPIRTRKVIEGSEHPEGVFGSTDPMANEDVAKGSGLRSAERKAVRSTWELQSEPSGVRIQ